MAVAEEFGLMVDPYTEQHQVLRRLNRFLIDNYAAGKRAVVCLDEAQAMPLETLESLRLLTNLETERRKLLQVVLFGQPELDERLDQPRVRQLRQRASPSQRETAALRSARGGVLSGPPPDGRRSSWPAAVHAEAVQRLHRAFGVFRAHQYPGPQGHALGLPGEGARIIDADRIADAVSDTESLDRSVPFARRLMRYVGLAWHGRY